MVVSPIAMVHGYRNQKVEKKIVPLTITPSKHLGKLLLIVPGYLKFYWPGSKCELLLL